MMKKRGQNTENRERRTENRKKTHGRKKAFFIFFCTLYSVLCTLYSVPAHAETVTLEQIPLMPKEAILSAEEKAFAYRGRIGGFALKPSKCGIFYDRNNFYPDATRPQGQKPASVKMMYYKADQKSFCGTYLILVADLLGYSTMTFMIKGQKGGEAFEIGLNDVYSNRREDAVMVGSIYRYLPEGITTQWQKVAIPLTDFFGPDMSKLYSLVFHYNEIGKGAFWIDNIQFHTEHLVNREDQIYAQGYLLLDNFDHNDINLLGRKAGTYKKLPSVCEAERVENPRFGNRGRSLLLTYKKESTGWCGYYTLLNQIDGEYYDLSKYKTVSFMVKGQEGTETFQLGMADRNWITIGDSLKAGQVDKFLPGGITTEWKEVVIPLEAFGSLNLSEMGSFVIDFNKKQEGIIYVDELKFILKSEEELLEEW